MSRPHPWEPIPREWLDRLTEEMPRGVVWPRSLVLMDLRRLQSKALAGLLKVWPSRAQLARRWTWGDKAVRNVLSSEEEWSADDSGVWAAWLEKHRAVNEKGARQGLGRDQAGAKQTEEVSTISESVDQAGSKQGPSRVHTRGEEKTSRPVDQDLQVATSPEKAPMSGSRPTAGDLFSSMVDKAGDFPPGFLTAGEPIEEPKAEPKEEPKPKKPTKKQERQAGLMQSAQAVWDEWRKLGTGRGITPTADATNKVRDRMHRDGATVEQIITVLRWAAQSDDLYPQRLRGEATWPDGRTQKYLGIETLLKQDGWEGRLQSALAWAAEQAPQQAAAEKPWEAPWRFQVGSTTSPQMAADWCRLNKRDLDRIREAIREAKAGWAELRVWLVPRVTDPDEVIRHLQAEAKAGGGR